jgi:hypothetical protein
MPENTPVWRYMSLDGVLQTIKTGKLRLTRIDRFDDPFEGSVPPKQIEDETLLLIGAASRARPGDEDPFLRATRMRRARTRSAHASCWSAGDESELLWRLYCNDDGVRGAGVALQTTLHRLETAVTSHDLYVSPMIYTRYHEAPSFKSEMDAMFHKRDAFSAEREVRLLKFDTTQFGLLAASAPAAELSDHIYVDWTGEPIEKIVISPYTAASYLDLVRNNLSQRLSRLAELSELHEGRHPAWF